MGTPITPPRILAGADGKPRLKLKRGRGAHDTPEGPHVHYFSRSGVRVDEGGTPTPARSRRNFRPIKWDLPDARPAESPGAPDLSAALALLRRSPTFVRLFDEVLRMGWVVELAAPGFGSGCRKGPQTLSLDASKRGAFVARLVHDVAYAHALEGPMPILDATVPAFPREDALYLMRCWGQAALHQALVRDEILAAGGADIGGPGLRGLQQEAHDIFRRQSVPLARVVDAISFSVDGTLAQEFRPHEGPKVLRNLKQAFIAPKVVVAGSLGAEMLQVLEQLRVTPSLDAHAVGRLFGVALAPRPLDVPTPYLEVSAALLSEGPFSWVELRAPVRGAAHLAPRLLLVPRYLMSHFDLSSWFGLGSPHHVDPLDSPVATAAYPYENRSMYVTYRAEDARQVLFFTFHGR